LNLHLTVAVNNVVLHQFLNSSSPAAPPAQAVAQWRPLPAGSSNQNNHQ